MPHRFFAETMKYKPALFQAMTGFSLRADPSASMPNELAALGTVGARLWSDRHIRRALCRARTEQTVPLDGWDFMEESRRLALLPAEDIGRLGLFFGAAVFADEIAKTIAKEQLSLLRDCIGNDIYSYALRRGRYQIGSIRDPLKALAADLPLHIGIPALARAVLDAVSQDWPSALRHTFLPGLPASTANVSLPPLSAEQHRALWFTLKKILVREAAPQWAPCFD